jgi:hypothetical protein
MQMQELMHTQMHVHLRDRLGWEVGGGDWFVQVGGLFW